MSEEQKDSVAEGASEDSEDREPTASPVAAEGGTESQPPPAEEPAAPSEPAPEPPKQAAAPAQPAPAAAKKSSSTGYLVSFVLGVVVGVLAYSFVDTSKAPTEPMPMLYRPPAPGGGSSGGGAALTPSGMLNGMLGSAARDALAVAKAVEAMNYGKAGERTGEMITLLERASLATTTEAERTALNGFLETSHSLRESVGQMAAESADSAKALAADLGAAAGLDQEEASPAGEAGDEAAVDDGEEAVGDEAAGEEAAGEEAAPEQEADEGDDADDAEDADDSDDGEDDDVEGEDDDEGEEQGV